MDRVVGLLASVGGRCKARRSPRVEVVAHQLCHTDPDRVDLVERKRFEWLAACSLYPELQWNLTLHLAAQLPDADTLLTESSLRRLVQLPWFRAGELPEELRVQLIATLSVERQRGLRHSIVSLLEVSPAPAGTHAAERGINHGIGAEHGDPARRAAGARCVLNMEVLHRF